MAKPLARVFFVEFSNEAGIGTEWQKTGLSPMPTKTLREVMEELIRHAEGSNARHLCFPRSHDGAFNGHVRDSRPLMTGQFIC